MYLKMHRLQRFACKRATVALVITLFLTTLLLSSQRVLSFQVPLPIRQSVQRRHHHHHQQQHRHVAAAGRQPSNTKAISVGGLWGNDMLQKSGCSASFPSSSSLQSRIQRNDRKKRRLSSRLFTFNNNQDINDDEMDDDNDDDGRDLVPAAAMTVDPIVKETSRQLKRISWFSWWAQVILSTISTTILIFAASVLRRSGGNLLAPSPPFLLSALSLILSATSVVWTWGNGTRLSRRLLRNNSKNKSSSSRDKGLVVSSSSPRATARITAANLLRRAVRIQVTINLLGLFLTILAAEQIVGSLAIKVLTTFVGGAGGGGVGIMPYGSAAGAAAAFVQPLDILVVQANTNTLLSHFVSLATSLFLTNQIRTLDPPNH